MIPDPIREAERTTHDLNQFMHRHSRTTFGRYPLTFAFLATFGVVAVLYGMDHILDGIPLMHERPLVPLVVGIILLIITGSLYKRIEKKFD